MFYKIIHRDNYGRDYDTEIEVTGIPRYSEETMQKLCKLMNELFGGPHADRFYVVVPSDYVCQVFDGY